MTDPRSHLHAEYDAASSAEREAWQRYKDAEQAMWAAENIWDRARERAQRAFVALSREPVVGELTHGGKE
jgi:hypothetical protein